MKKVLKILGWLVLVILVVVGGLIAYVQTSWDKKYTDTPYPDIHASKDSAVIAWGKYLVHGPAHCTICHAANGEQMAADAGKDVPLMGGWELSIPPGTFRSRNLTSDPETGLGKHTDGEIARALRYNVDKTGMVLFPFMPFQDMSDYDLTAIISYLRTLPPAKHAVKPSDYSFLGKFIYWIGFKPRIPETQPIAKAERDSTPEYGKYLATCVANCMGCHTDRDLKSGEFVGKPFAGGMQMPADASTLGFGFISPNLTPDMETGTIASWTETAFVNRMKGGRVHKGSHMPWGPFSRMDEVDLKAIYRYLRTIDPVKNLIEKTVFPPGEKFPPPIDWTSKK